MTNRRDGGGEELVNQMMYLLTGPYVGFPGWEDLLRNHKDRIIVERMKHHKEIFETQQCSEFEAMLYLSTASLAQPIGHDWAQIYLYLFNGVMPEVAKDLDVLPDRPELNENQKDDLLGLRRWIFKQQMAHMRAKGRTARAVGLQESRQGPELVQLSFFDQEV